MIFEKPRDDLWAECGATVTKLENLLLDSNEGTIRGVVESDKSVNIHLLGELKRPNASYNPLIQEVTDLAFVSTF